MTGDPHALVTALADRLAAAERRVAAGETEDLRDVETLTRQACDATARAPAADRARIRPRLEDALARMDRLAARLSEEADGSRKDGGARVRNGEAGAAIRAYMRHTGSRSPG